MRLNLFVFLIFEENSLEASENLPISKKKNTNERFSTFLQNVKK